MVAIVSVEHGYQQKTAEPEAALDARPVITSAHPLEESLAAFWAYLNSTRMPGVRNIPSSEATPVKRATCGSTQGSASGLRYAKSLGTSALRAARPPTTTSPSPSRCTSEPSPESTPNY